MLKPRLVAASSLIIPATLAASIAISCGGDDSSSSPAPHDDTSTGGSSSLGGAGSGSGGQTGPSPDALTVSPYIVVDQFGYLEDSEKVAVLRDPDTGYDADESYAPGSTYQIVGVADGRVSLEVAPAAWGGGAVHGQSGDRAWSVDFSALTTPGEYYVLDVDNGVRSDAFRIGPDVYQEVLRQAFRTFYYQRAGFAKEAPFADEGYEDSASHVGPGQDKNARLFGQTDDAGTERDLSGGWYDAGDYNRYTAWSADYVVAFLRMFEERPDVFGDDFNIPESGNGVPDILDEARFGLEQLIKTQADTGGCISVLGTDPQYATASPPSTLTAASVYGPETTNATIRAGIAFAWAARIFAEIDAEFATDMLRRAELAWSFADANPDLVFENTGKIAAGEQQSNDEDIAQYKLGLAVALAAAGGDASHVAYFDANYGAPAPLFLNGYAAGWQLQFIEYYLDYAKLPSGTPAIQQEILTGFAASMGSDANLGMLTVAQDPYLAFVDTYTWGSNAHKSRTGCLFYDLITFDVDASLSHDARVAAERYIHYLHGVNPLGLVYLTNMSAFGAHNSASTIYHAWFANGSSLWDEVGLSTYGPPPGFLAGGPNPSYALDGACPAQDGCPAEAPAPPAGQPDQKSYANFNDGWPVNSWAVTENSNGYQVYYLRLLSKFVQR